MSIEAMIDLGLYVLSDCFEGFQVSTINLWALHVFFKANHSTARPVATYGTWYEFSVLVTDF